MNTTFKLNSCPKCGESIRAEAPQGLCPKCLLAQASVLTETGIGPSKSSPPTQNELAVAFPHLKILELIGSGGMGFVFKARQPKLERFVALKILPQSLAADPAFADRFTREGRVLAQLNHPNIVTIHDFGQAGDFFYLLMEFVDGVNLRQAMKVGRFTPAQALGVVPKICEALQFAHNEGILHRDIKPENVMLDSKGRVKIADFGIAKILGTENDGAELPASANPGTTETDRQTGIIGTPQYMAPEQVEHPQDVDQRADIYSLGVVFYEMLTGELPTGHFAPPSEKCSVDTRVDGIVLRTLEKERERRTRTAGEVKTAVENVAQSLKPANECVPPWDWRTWSPGQSPLVREICVHMTEPEKNKVVSRGVFFGMWIAPISFGSVFVLTFAPRPISWLFASIIFLVGIVVVSIMRRKQLEFLCTTAWARQQGFTPNQLKLFGRGRFSSLIILILALLMGLGLWILILRKAPAYSIKAQPQLPPASDTNEPSGARRGQVPTD